jgi:hypothetical protein
MLRSLNFSGIAQNVAKHGPALPRGLMQFRRDYEDVMAVKHARDKGREEREPLAQDTFAPLPFRFTPHEANLFVDKELDISREQFRKFRQFKKDALSAAPFAAPLFFGVYGLIPIALAFRNEHFLPTSLTRREGESFNQQMIRRYAEHIDQKRLKYGPQVQRLTLTLSTIQKGPLPTELVPVWRNLFWNHVDNEHQERDVTKVPEFAAYASGDLNLHGAEGRNFSFMEWYRHSLDFIGEVHHFGTPFVFSQFSQNWEDYKLRLLNWYEDIKQDSYMIRREGGSGALSDEELLLSCLDRAICRVEEKLSRAELRKRLDDWFYLEDTKVEIPHVLAWAGGYHWDHVLDLEPFIEQSHLWQEPTSKLPARQPDLDPFMDMQLNIRMTSEQERLVETYREIWAKSPTEEDRDLLFNALAELVAEGAPGYVNALRPDVHKAVIAHVTTNLLQRGNNPSKLAEGAEEGFTLPATTIAELRGLVYAREDRVLPKACNPEGFLSTKAVPSVDEWKWPVYLPQDPATTFEHPSLKLAWLPPRVHKKNVIQLQ